MNTGNEMFRKRRYRESLKEYSAGLKECAEDPLLNAVLLTNRAAAQFHLGEDNSIISASWILMFSSP